MSVFNKLGISTAEGPMITASVVEVTPSMAREMLKRNTRNRALSQAILKHYIKDMVDGKWKDSASQIQISMEGNLLNGQHRLTAIVRSGTTQIFTVTEGLEDSTHTVMDLGKGRSTGDALKIAKVSGYNILAAAIRFRLGWSRGGSIQDIYRPLRYLSRAQMIDLVLLEKDKIKNIAEIVKVSSNAHGAMAALNPSSTAAFLIEAENISVRSRFGSPGARTYHEAIQFIQQVSRGEMLAPKDPILVLRNRLYKMYNAKDKIQGDAAYKVSLLVHAWNARVMGKVALRFSIHEFIPKMKPYNLNKLSDDLPY